MPKKGDDLRGKCKRNNWRRGGRWTERTKDEEVGTKEEKEKDTRKRGERGGVDVGSRGGTWAEAPFVVAEGTEGTEGTEGEGTKIMKMRDGG